MRIFWGRTLCCILVPPLLTIYYAIIWHYWLQSYDYDSPVNHGTEGARRVYYSWFILSAVGINLSKYGLAGVEAGMLMNRRWAARNAMQLIMQCDKVSPSLSISFNGNRVDHFTTADLEWPKRMDENRHGIYQREIQNSAILYLVCTCHCQPSTLYCFATLWSHYGIE